MLIPYDLGFHSNLDEHSAAGTGLVSCAYRRAELTIGCGATGGGSFGEYIRQRFFRASSFHAVAMGWSSSCVVFRPRLLSGHYLEQHSHCLKHTQTMSSHIDKAPAQSLPCADAVCSIPSFGPRFVLH